MTRLKIGTLVTVLLAACLLLGCGKKGPPDPPGPPARIIYPKTYPSF